MAAFQYKSTKMGDVTLVAIGGNLDVISAKQFDQKLSADISKGARRVVLSLAKVNYIASAGLGIIVGNNSTLKQRGGEIRLSSLPDNIAKIFELLSFSKLFKIFKTDDEAVKSFDAK